MAKNLECSVAPWSFTWSHGFISNTGWKCISNRS